MSRLIARSIQFQREEMCVLDDISFEHEAGVLAILGPSGSGKTTLMWILAGLLKPRAGIIQYLDGQREVRPRFGFVFQNGGLWDHLSVRGHLEVVAANLTLDRKRRRNKIEAILSDTGLLNLSSRRPGELSGGERQRLALARALVVDPDWILLDEPTSQLDGPARQTLLDLLTGQLEGRAGVILATHQADQAMRLGDRIAILIGAKVAQLGPPGEVYDEPASLEVARMLGPACELSANAAMQIGHLPESLAARDRVILRPENLAFEVVRDGVWKVCRQYRSGRNWLLELIGPGGAEVSCASAYAVPRASGGRLRYVGIVEAGPGSV